MIEKLLTVDEVAIALRLTPKAVRQRVARRELPFRKMGRFIRFSEKEVARFVNGLPGCEIGEVHGGRASDERL